MDWLIGAAITVGLIAVAVATAFVALVWREGVDRIDYAWTFGRLWVLDRIAGPLPATDADDARERDMERLRQAFPDIDVDGTGPAGGARRRRQGG